MAARADLEAQTRVDLGPGPAVAPRDLRERCERIELGHRFRGARDLRGALERSEPQPLEQLALERRRALGSAAHLAFDLAQPRRREALGVGERLAALVIGRNPLAV